MQQKLRSLYTDPLYRNSIALMLNSAIGAFFGLLFWIVAARTMPAKDIGLATAAISIAALIVGLSKLGLDAGLVRYLPGSKNRNGLYSTIVMITLGIALVISAVFFAYIAVTSIYSVQNIAFISIRRADLSLIQNLLLGARIPILLFIAGMGVFGVFSSLGVAYLMTFAFGAFVLRRYGDVDKRRVKEILS